MNEVEQTSLKESLSLSISHISFNQLRLKLDTRMALVTFSGFPCSGKTTRARQLETYLSHRLSLPDCPPHLARTRVLVINDESLSLSKAVYDGQLRFLSDALSINSLNFLAPDGRAEKPARASLFSTVQRHLGPDCIVIVDAMNYIKGSRYQMYCQAREIQVRNCTVRSCSFCIAVS